MARALRSGHLITGPHTAYDSPAQRGHDEGTPMTEPQETVETRGDDRVDLLASDTNGDGKPDVWVSDTDGDGKADLFQFDTDGDGKVDITMVDLDEDGTPDTIVDGDGGHPPTL
jgi:hypothetical protein